jgi:phospholipid transport system substrate-binding protein
MPKVVVRRTSCHAGLAVLTCAVAVVATGTAGASGTAVRRPGAALGPCTVGAQSPGVGPLDELRRTYLALQAALRRRAPDWSPEADALKFRVDSTLAATLDYEEIARRALDPQWDRLTDVQRRQFLRMFSALTNQAFVAAMTRPDVHLRFDSELVTGPVASVVVTAWAFKPASDADERIEYRLAKKMGRWLIYDVLIDRVSLVDGYRDQFARLMTRGGFPEIVARMQHKLEVARAY